MSVCCFGAIHLDTLAHATREVLRETSTPAAFSSRPGGVATNVARALLRLGVPVSLVGALGDDAEGRTLLERLADEGVDVRPAICPGVPTGRYIAIHDPDGSLPAAVVDGRITDGLAVDALDEALPAAASARLWFLDANLPAPLLERLASAAGERRLAADTVSRAKAGRLRALLPRLDLLFCNRAEAAALTGHDEQEPLPDPEVLARTLRAAGLRACCLSDGAAPLLLMEGGDIARLDVEVEPGAVRDVTGAGDALISGTLAGLDHGRDLRGAVAAGLRAAALTLRCDGAVAATLSWPAIADG
ncbi:PfkB family carbohydrate kinase [Stappia sp.]|uniref:PfkB family carbohydrate kinase n=1 Tax=Stappia sp. TaxID=1870903 RepID=UPI003A999ACE